MSAPALDPEVETFARIAFDAYDASWITAVRLDFDTMQPQVKERWYAVARAVLAEPRGTLF